MEETLISDKSIARLPSAACLMIGPEWTSNELYLTSNNVSFVSLHSLFLFACLMDIHSQSHEGGYSQQPTGEALGGTTYCALASLHLAPPPSSSHSSSSTTRHRITEEDRQRTIRWLFQNQTPSGGFSGRTNKVADACYCFWCGASLYVCSRLLFPFSILISFMFISINFMRLIDYLGMKLFLDSGSRRSGRHHLPRIFPRPMSIQIRWDRQGTGK